VSARFDRRARAVLPDAAAWRRHDASVYRLREQRDAAAAGEPDFEALRSHAAALKAHVLASLASQLLRFEAAALAAGAQVHWAEDADAANAIVGDLLASRGVRRVVKSKSMLTEECGTNRFLEAKGIEVVDTDLGERIVQLAGEPPSHLVVPAVHKTRAEIGALFHRALGTPPGESDPERLVAHARRHLRERFLLAEAAITGANFLVAETGSLVLCTNEGNADLGIALAPLHVACVGIEKLVPTLADLAVFLRLLARSATGQPITAYTTLVTGPRPGGALHVVLVDNGRTRLLASESHARALACIRCGACLNTCPVYRRAGGHAYGLTVPGPIGAVLAPASRGGREAAELPFASSLCGSCSAVCPVKIDLHEQLLAWRRERNPFGVAARLALRATAWLMASRFAFEGAGRLARLAWPLLARRFPGNPAGAWLAGRELPPHPGASYRARARRRATSR
jgi:L-lactate dehydrogenase complex protein LldF